MKHIRQLLMAALLLVTSSVWAYDFEVDGIYYRIINNSEPYEVYVDRNYNIPYSGDVVIPASVTYGGIGYSVTRIGESAFRRCSGLTSIEMPYSVTDIGDHAFGGCTSLTSVEIPNSVTTIGNYAFIDCTSLTSIVIPNSVTAIGNKAFLNCRSATSLRIGNLLTSIGYDAFIGCDGLMDILVSSGNPKYDSRNNCNALIETETNTLLLGCQNSFIPNTVTSIGNDAFGGCTSLTSVEIPNSVTTIGNYAFSSCTGLTSIVIPNSVTTIGNYAFSSCTGLTSIVIPNSVTTIGNCAFSSCTCLTSLTIGNSLTSFGDYAFYGCNSLTSIVVSSGNPKYDSRNNCNAIIDTETNMLLFGCQTSIVPHSVTSIGDYAFYHCENLTSINFPNSLTSIGEYAFCNCENLASVDLPNSLTSVGKQAFYICTALSSIEIPSSVTNIGAGAFACPYMVSIKVNPGNPIYDSRDNCNAIIKTDSVILVQGCMTTDIPSTVITIGKSAFNRCYGLVSIQIPNSVKNIEDYAFCISGLTSIDIPNSVTDIGEYAFYKCDSLTSVTIGGSVTRVMDRAFWNCTSLSDLTLKLVTPPDWDDLQFTGFSLDTVRLHVPCGTKDAYSNATYWKKFANITDRVFPYDVYVQSSDEHLGLVRLVQQPNCDNNQAVVAADPIGDHPFLSWTVNGHVVSYANPYTFTVEDDIELVANFYGTGIDEETAQEVSVSPNPAQNRIKVNCDDMRNVSLFSPDGRRVKTINAMGVNEMEIDLSGMAKGFYMLRIETQNGKTINRKIIVQ